MVGTTYEFATRVGVNIIFQPANQIFHFSGGRGGGTVFSAREHLSNPGGGVRHGSQIPVFKTRFFSMSKL